MNKCEKSGPIAFSTISNFHSKKYLEINIQKICNNKIWK